MTTSEETLYVMSVWILGALFNNAICIHPAFTHSPANIFSFHGAGLSGAIIFFSLFPQGNDFLHALCKYIYCPFSSAFPGVLVPHYTAVVCKRERWLSHRQPGWWMEFNLCNIHAGWVLWVNHHGSTSSPSWYVLLGWLNSLWEACT